MTALRLPRPRTLLLTGTAALVAALAVPTPANADVSFADNLTAVGTSSYVRKWVDYQPGDARVRSDSRGTAKVRVTAYQVIERVRNFDYYVLDVDVTTSGRSGSGASGSEALRVHDHGATAYDRDDSKSLHSNADACRAVGVGMTSSWPVVTDDDAVGHAMLCAGDADVVRADDDGDAVFRGSHLGAVRHLTLQRWVKVGAGKKPILDVGVVLPSDRCTAGDGDGHCLDFVNGYSYRSITLGTTG